jgi:hypothetical protein
MDEQETLFIFYTYNSIKGSFNIDDLPKGWRWVGAGKTYPFSKNSEENIKKPKYQIEEQFSGPEETKNETIKFLNNVLKDAKKRGILKCYKIEESYQLYGRGIRVE